MTKLKISKLREIGIIQTGHFVLSCGKHSDTFFECSRLLFHPSIFASIAGDIARSVMFSGLAFDAILSPAIGGITVGYELSRLFKVPFMYTEKNDSLHYLPSFFTIKNKRILIVDDVITSGSTVDQMISLIGAKGATAVGIGCIVNKESISFDLPVYAYLVLSLKSYSSTSCPLCKNSRP